MPQWLVKPNNAIKVSGPDWAILECEVGANATAAKMIPGRFVIDDTTDGHVKEAGAAADNALGVLDVMPDVLITDAYAVGDQVRVLTPPCRAVVTLASVGSAVSPGDPIVTAADGKAAKQAVGAMGAQGAVVAIALESQDPAAADKTCMVQLTYASEPAAAS